MSYEHIKKTEKAFANVDEAFDWMYEVVDDPCVDNTRFAYMDDLTASQKYMEAQEGGCCGYFDREIQVGGRAAIIGCNYGH
jgi:hypothetical protein